MDEIFTEPLVSILMAAYNVEDFIEKSIRSILSQSYQKIEVLISDDCSSDRTRNKIEKISDPRIKCFHNNANIGNLKTINKLLEHARGEYITFQDADDWSDPNRILFQVEFLKNNKTIFLCGTQYFFIENQKCSKICDLPLTHNQIVSYINKIGSPPYCAASCMIRNEVYREIGGYREYFNRIGAADSDWYFRIMERFKVSNLADPLYFYRKNQNSFTNTVSINLNKLISSKIAFFLYEQRKNIGKDAIQRNALVEMEDFSKELLYDYLTDSSLIYNLIAKSYIEQKRFLLSIKYIFIGILKGPWMKKNYSLLKYCLWKFRFLS